MTKELAEAGVESTIALGPLLMKTNGKETAAQGGQSIVLPMPILVKSTYGVMHCHSGGLGPLGYHPPVSF